MLTKKIAIILWMLPVLFVMSSFLGLQFSIHWGATNYDSWRLQQLAILTIIIITYTICWPISFIKTSQKQVVGLISFFILTSLSVYEALDNQLALLDLCWMIALTTVCYILSDLQRIINKHNIERLLAIMSLSPLWIVLWLFIGYGLYISQQLPLAWHGLFSNIRYFDDALLPCIFLLWYQPSFLRRYTITVIGISSCYLLTLWLDASRANWLAILIGIFSSVLIYRGGYKVIKVPILSILFSFILYQMILHIQPTSIVTTVIRNDTNVRKTMWLGSLDTWMQAPITGIGGANFINLNNQINLESVGHPHNLFIQLLVEWGISGVIVIFLILLGYYKLFKVHQQIPLILFAGTIALLINSLLSGAAIYPVSQMDMLLFISFVSRYCFDSNIITSYPKKFYRFYPNWLGCFFILIMLIMLKDSILQYGNTIESTNSSLGPRFWSNAKVLNLTPKSFR